MPHRQNEAVVSADLLTVAETLNKTDNEVKTEDFKSWKKSELQKRLWIHGLRETVTTRERSWWFEWKRETERVETAVESDACEKEEIKKRATEKPSTPTEILPYPKNCKIVD